MSPRRSTTTGWSDSTSDGAVSGCCRLVGHLLAVWADRSTSTSCWTDTRRGPTVQSRPAEENLRRLGAGDEFRFAAEVGEFNADQCLFFLKPVSTETR
ncbi:DUF4839 domain-containing protein [Streptomyces goshikiensis]|uniref:DUF4839 domain-containing protein n=1 Tax=Streptomyces goshikiensis TaxID=1942 RepID=UPI00382749CA